MKNSEPNFSELKDSLTQQVPNSVKSTVPNSLPKNSANDIIKKYNDSMVGPSNDARLAAIWSFVTNEEERAKRQKPLLYIVVSLTAFQLLAFNVIVGAITWFSFENGDINVLTQLFEILKYYIGATVAELIGMIWFVTKGTFSSDHIKTLEIMLKNGMDSNNEDDSHQDSP